MHLAFAVVVQIRLEIVEDWGQGRALWKFCCLVLGCGDNFKISMSHDELSFLECCSKLYYERQADAIIIVPRVSLAVLSALWGDPSAVSKSFYCTHLPEFVLSSGVIRRHGKRIWLRCPEWLSQPCALLSRS